MLSPFLSISTRFFATVISGNAEIYETIQIDFIFNEIMLQNEQSIQFDVNIIQDLIGV